MIDEGHSIQELYTTLNKDNDTFLPASVAVGMKWIDLSMESLQDVIKEED